MFVIFVEVAILTKTFGVVEFKSMFTFKGQRLPTVEMVAAIAHSLGVMQHINMGASGDYLSRSDSLFDNPFSINLKKFHFMNFLLFLQINLF